jgi:hypothetical protein
MSNKLTETSRRRPVERLVRKRIAEAWGELPDKLGMVKCRKCHGIAWRFDLVDVRTRDTVKRADSQTKLRLWAEVHGWVIPNE